MWTVWKPRAVMLLSVLAGVTQFELPLLRPVAATVFLLVCPGAALLGFVRLKSVVAEVVLSIALSMALLTIIANLTVLLGSWSLEAGFWFLLATSLLCTTFQILSSYRDRWERPFL